MSSAFSDALDAELSWLRVPELSVGIVGCIQTHGSLANWHPHIHMIVTDGGFREGRHLRPLARARHRSPH
jgi:hypothetical protein